MTFPSFSAVFDSFSFTFFCVVTVSFGWFCSFVVFVTELVAFSSFFCSFPDFLSWSSFRLALAFAVSVTLSCFGVAEASVLFNFVENSDFGKILSSFLSVAFSTFVSVTSVVLFFPWRVIELANFACLSP